MCKGDARHHLALCQNKDRMLYEKCNFMRLRGLILGAD